MEVGTGVGMDVGARVIEVGAGVGASVDVVAVDGKVVDGTAVDGVTVEGAAVEGVAVVGVSVGDGVGEASNKTDDPVPTIAATAIRRPFTWPTEFETLAQLAEVAEVQLGVEHEAVASQTVADSSNAPNCKPEMVR